VVVVVVVTSSLSLLTQPIQHAHNAVDKKYGQRERGKNSPNKKKMPVADEVFGAPQIHNKHNAEDQIASKK
ncbi:MAG: hypothetical protein ACMV0F_06855, partial [Trichlorobacter sp.]